MRPVRSMVIPSLLCLTGATLALPGVSPLGDALWQRSDAQRGTVVVPDRFLRRWDPVTVFYGDDQVEAPGPLDEPGRFASMSPEHPGAWRWLDRRTLQFQPADPWPPLRRFSVKADGEAASLATLMPAPIGSEPWDGASGLDPVERIRLTFPEPIPIEALGRMITLHLRPLGAGAGGDARRLTAEDFSLKLLQRADETASARYVLHLKRPIPGSTEVELRLALSLDDTTQAVHTMRFSTAGPFQIDHVGCSSDEQSVGPEGGRFPRSRPMRCTGERKLYISFNAALGEIGPLEGRRMVRFEPAVPNVKFERMWGERLAITGDFARETPYKITIQPTPIADEKGRPLELGGEISLWAYFPQASPYLRWQAAQGIAEVGGPQRVPLRGRGHGRVDLRVHRIDPLDRSFWPFPDEAPQTDESQRPPGPGERPEAWTSTERISPDELGARLAALGSPGVSTLVELPLKPDGEAATFGLDLAPHLRRIAGGDRPGHYLVGLRLLDGSTRRAWMRLQVTDLSLTAVEARDATRFVVTSLSTGAPVKGARLSVEGVVRETGEEDVYTTVFEGRTDARGMVRWVAPGQRPHVHTEVRRVVVTRGKDQLVLDPEQSLDMFRDGHWRYGGPDWLSWPFGALESRVEKPRRQCHVFTERPIYRPEHPVHIKGWLRSRYQGALSTAGSVQGIIEIRGPGGAVWKLPAPTGDAGGFYARWDEEGVPTGVYEAMYMVDGALVCRADFEVEAYRLPTFKVDLSADKTVPLDQAFEIKAQAAYYAGGQVIDAPVRWRVTQFPYTWTPTPKGEAERKARAGFVYSSDGRYARVSRFNTRSTLVHDGRTGERGQAALSLDPTVEPTAAPRTYVIESTVTGAGDQTVTSVRRVNAVPAFALGLKVARYQPTAETIEPQILVAGPDGGLIEGLPVKVTLKRRAWHAHLQASDFSHGEARYVTDVVDEVVRSETVTSGKAPITLKLPIDRAGVYLVELEARDKLGRAQAVTVDLYAGGTGAVSWDKPKSGVFELSADKRRHAPGQTARIIIQSPFQRAEALAIVETPKGNEYRWVKVRDGKGSFELKIDGGWAPRLPVHVVLMRGRIAAAPPSTQSSKDLGKPTTVASTLWLKVEPRANQVKVELTHPEAALPGQTVPLTVRLTDPDGRPRGGEVTLWLVDAAVLALAKEAPLDPLPAFLARVQSRLAVRDTRNLGFGRIPFAEMPGGGDGEDLEDTLDQMTVRRDFQPVPYYEAALKVPDSGRRTVQVKLPDNLTVFAIRAKVASGPERFGFGKSEILIRQPVLVQPALPRFLRPGDAFELAAIGRVLDGPGGAGVARLKTEGLDVSDAARRPMTWPPQRPAQIAWRAVARTPAVDDKGEPAFDMVKVQVAAQRTADGAGDAFEVPLPLRPDRRPIHRRRVAELEPGVALALAPLPEAARPGTVRRTLVLSTEPALVKMAAALDSLRRRPEGNTEQRLSRARALLGAGALRRELMLEGAGAMVNAAVAETLAWLPQVLDARGRVAYWPGGEGQVALTAWAGHFVADARAAGYTVDGRLAQRLTEALRNSLRADAQGFVSQWYERAQALDGLAHLEALDAPYFAELARNARYLDYGALSGVILAARRQGPDAVDSGLLGELVGLVADGVTTRLYRGDTVYGGVRARGDAQSPLIHPSEARTLAQMVRALVAAGDDRGRLPLMVDALIRLGHGDGWGSSAADGPALLALTEWMGREQATGTPQVTVTLSTGGREERLILGGEAGNVLQWVGTSAEAATLTLEAADPEARIVALEMVRYIPAAPAMEAEAQAEGFVVNRRWLKVPEGVDAGPSVKVPIEGPGQTLEVTLGDIIEGHVQVVSPEARHHVSITVPLAAGLEPLNPNLRTAPPEATPSGQTSAAPDYVEFLDDRMVWHYDTLPKGTHDFYYRAQATVTGRFGQPPARAEMAYARAIRGRSPGASVLVAPKADR